jgi:hypothetical protein
MRRFLVYFAVLGFLGTFVTGCCCCGGGGGGGGDGGHVHGICDCYQITPCNTRQPWVIQAPPPAIDGPALESKKL